jgi:hypothetical protein
MSRKNVQAPEKIVWGPFAVIPAIPLFDSHPLLWYK